MMMRSSGDDEQVLILAPIGRDGDLAKQVLAESGLSGRVCPDVETLCRAIGDGAGCALITEENLSSQALQEIAAVLALQPPWSDFPIVLFSAGASAKPQTAAALQPLGNVTLLERPVHVRTMISAVQAALRGRRRQYEGRRAIERRDQFLAMLGHELRNPLGAILIAIEVMKRKLEQANCERERSIIERQTRHLTRLVDDLLDVSRMNSGKVALKRQPVDLNALVSHSVSAMNEQIAARGHKLNLRLVSHPLTVDGDPVRLEQVMVNLLTNAVKYTPEGGQIAVELSFENGQAQIRVSDNGVGIDPSLLDSIFDLFAQAPSTLDRSQGGLGIGLTLVRNLIELHGGQVSATSEGTNRGSTFVVRLPAMAEAKIAPQEVVPQRAAPKMRVLIIDDNIDLREVLQHSLKLSGYSAETAPDGKSGLDALLRTRPEVAIIDVGLPGIDGYEVARRARAEVGRSMLLIAMTGYGQPEDRSRAKEAGFDVHLTKPVTTSALRKTIERYAHAVETGQSEINLGDSKSGD